MGKLLFFSSARSELRLLPSAPSAKNPWNIQLLTGTIAAEGWIIGDLESKMLCFKHRFEDAQIVAKLADWMVNALTCAPVVLVGVMAVRRKKLISKEDSINTISSLSTTMTMRSVRCI
jgi:hypothetical protein